MGFIVWIIVLFLIFNLRSRVAQLEKIAKGGVAQPAPQPIPLSMYVKEQPVEALPTGPTSGDKFINWLKEDWLLKVGAMLLIIGFGWLTTYAFLNNWIGPMGRIALGIVAGALFIMLGWWRIKKYIDQGGVFLVLGSTVVLLTIFAAREIYHFFSPLSALAVMFLSTAFVALASVKYNNRALALASLILAGIAPMLTDSPSGNYVQIFAYLFVVTLGTIWVAALTNRRELTVASLLLVVFYSIPHLVSFVSSDKETLLLFAYAFSSLFFFANTFAILKAKSKEIMPDLIAALGNGIFLLSWIMVAAQDEWKSLIIATWMIVFAAGAFLIFRISGRQEPFYVYAGVGVAMLAAATSAELEGATLVIAYTIESAAVAFLGYKILRDIKVAAQASFLLIGPAILSLESLASEKWTTTILQEDFFVLLLLSLVLLGLGYFFTSKTKQAPEQKVHQTGGVLLVAGSIYAYALLWLSLHAGLQNDNTAVTISLLSYTIIGLVFYFRSFAVEQSGPRMYGGALVGFVVARLLLVDVWKMALSGKIVIFFLVGALLVSTAFLSRKKQDSTVPENKI